MYEQISRNKRRTALLVLGTIAFVTAVGYAFGRAFVGGYAGVVVAFLAVGGMSWLSYRHGDRLVLRAMRARPVTHEEEPRLHNVVEGIALAAGLPKPAVYVVDEKALNAFATGRDARHSSIAVTRGLLETMNRVELEGVVAHEMSHVLGRDILLGTVVATLVGSVVLLSESMLRWFWWGGARRRDGDGAGSAVLAVLGLVLAVLAPVVAQVIRLAVSRRREFQADAQGALLTRYPPGLASALRKIAADTSPMRVANNATGHLWLKQPSRTPGEGHEFFERLFATHPPMEERIRILEEM